jgi:plasmid stabilization system protein ParE
MEYEAFYLPLVLTALEDILQHTAEDETPQLAEDLLARIDRAVEDMLKAPHSCPLFRAWKPLKAEYRELRVDHVVLYYVVKGDTVEIRRVISMSKP